jgi:hypothetical protein
MNMVRMIPVIKWLVSFGLGSLTSDAVLNGVHMSCNMIAKTGLT